MCLPEDDEDVNWMTRGHIVAAVKVTPRLCCVNAVCHLLALFVEGDHLETTLPIIICWRRMDRWHVISSVSATPFHEILLGQLLVGLNCWVVSYNSSRDMNLDVLQLVLKHWCEANLPSVNQLIVVGGDLGEVL